MTTRDRIREMISQKPMTRNEIAARLSISKKTVSNRLSEIHGEIHDSYMSGENRFYNILDDTRRGNRYFNIRSVNSRTRRPSSSITHGSRTFSLDRLKFTSDTDTLVGVYKR